MGGFGALDLAMHHQGEFCAAGGHSPALYTSGAESAAGAFDDAEDFAANDVIQTAVNDPGAFDGLPVWLDAGNVGPVRARRDGADFSPAGLRSRPHGQEQLAWWPQGGVLERSLAGLPQFLLQGPRPVLNPLHPTRSIRSRLIAPATLSGSGQPPAGRTLILKIRADKRLQLPVLAIAFLVTVCVALPSGAAALTLPPADPPPADPPASKANLSKVLKVARRELGKNVVERKGNNVPRYHGGKGKIAPYSIKAFWCVAFSTWVWAHAGITSYLGADLLWPSYDGTTVAVQVKDMSRWAKRTGRWSYRARPGYLVAYGKTHMGIVLRADRQGRAVKSIEGNKSDSVTKVDVPMELVSGYISPDRLTPSEVVSRTSVRADVD